jgi:hypothetical protein
MSPLKDFIKHMLLYDGDSYNKTYHAHRCTDKLCETCNQWLRLDIKCILHFWFNRIFQIIYLLSVICLVNFTYNCRGLETWVEANLIPYEFNKNISIVDKLYWLYFGDVSYEYAIYAIAIDLYVLLVMSSAIALEIIAFNLYMMIQTIPAVILSMINLNLMSSVFWLFAYLNK